MLGRLARWLRFLGFDTLYYSGISDANLVKIAKEQDRTILTRDTRLVKMKGLGGNLLITSNDSFRQLLEVLQAFNLNRFDFLGRCVKCNGELLKIADKERVKDAVPEYVFLQHSDFLKCPDCGKIYWQGSHPKKFREKMAEILPDVS